MKKYIYVICIIAICIFLTNGFMNIYKNDPEGGGSECYIYADGNNENTMECRSGWKDVSRCI